MKALTTECEEFFRYYPETSDTETQVAWLRSVVLDDIDPDLYPCILAKHKIETEAGYDELIENYWGNAEPETTEIKLSDLNDVYFNKPINYEFFVAFSGTGSAITPSLEGDFTLSPPCYSLPFLEALYQANKQGTLVLTMGKFEGEVTIVLKIKGTSSNFFDFSQIPPITTPGKISI